MLLSSSILGRANSLSPLFATDAAWSVDHALRPGSGVTGASRRCSASWSKKPITV